MQYAHTITIEFSKKQLCLLAETTVQEKSKDDVRSNIDVVADCENPKDKLRHSGEIQNDI